MDVHATAAEYVRGVRAGEFTCEEFVGAVMERVREADPVIRAYLSVSPDAAGRARGVDRALRSGPDPGPLCGLPVSLKDNICTRALPTTCASRMLEGYRSPFDATAAARLEAAGAVITGKTNMDEFAMGLTTEFSAYGPTRNPWDTSRVPGGSSGGSAAAVAAGMCSASLGSDTGGSVRNPASFCSLVGLKPTYGLVSRYGLVSYANSIEQIGPIARTAEDAAMLLDAVAGRDPNDDTTVDADPRGYSAHVGAGVEGARVGVLAQTMEGAAPEAAGAARRAADALAGLGASCEDAEVPGLEHSVAAYYTITSAEAGSNLARYDGVRYGAAAAAPEPGAPFAAHAARARRLLGPEVVRRMLLGGFVPSAGHAGRYLLKALRVRQALAREAARALGRFDYLLSPTVPVLPFPLGEKIGDPVALFLVDYNTVLANLTGAPAVSVPFEMAGGLPVGVQLMAAPGRDGPLLGAAHALQGEADVPDRPPEALPA